LEVTLAKFSGKYCFGDEITVADAYLVPQVYNAKRFKVDMSNFPTIEKIVGNLEGIVAFQKAHPSNQPDSTE
jgi:glutathione S-transferase